MRATDTDTDEAQMTVPWTEEEIAAKRLPSGRRPSGRRSLEARVTALEVMATSLAMTFHVKHPECHECEEQYLEWQNYLHNEVYRG